MHERVGRCEHVVWRLTCEWEPSAGVSVEWERVGDVSAGWPREAVVSVSAVSAPERVEERGPEEPRSAGGGRIGGRSSSSGRPSRSSSASKHESRPLEEDGSCGGGPGPPAGLASGGNAKGSLAVPCTPHSAGVTASFMHSHPPASRMPHTPRNSHTTRTSLPQHSTAQNGSAACTRANRGTASRQGTPWRSDRRGGAQAGRGAQREVNQ